MNLKSILNSFSRRGKEPDLFIYEIAEALRNRILMYCKDVFSNKESEIGAGDYSAQFLEEIHEKLSMLHGKAVPPRANSG